MTGGAGFLGSHLCEELLARGDHVVCLDDLSSGRVANISHLLDCERFTFVEGDVRGEIAFDGPFGAVAHLASPASPRDYLNRPLDSLTTGSQGTLNALKFAQAKNARFVLASTSEVYGDPLVHPQPETYSGNVNPIGPRSVYDEAKRFAESLTTTYGANGVDVGIIRIFNTYGPRMRADDGRVVSSFVVQALSGAPMTVFGDARQTRSFCYVDDLIRGIIAMLDCSEPGPINLGNPQELCIKELAELVIYLTKSSSEITHLPLPEDDPIRRKPVIERAAQRLGWAPSVPIEVGLTKTIEWYRQHPDDGECRTGPDKNFLRQVVETGEVQDPAWEGDAKPVETSGTSAPERTNGAIAIGADRQLSVDRRRPRWVRRPSNPRVSIVVPAMNEAANIREVLPYLSDYYEVIVVLPNTGDKESEDAARMALPSAKVIRQTRTGKGNALTCGFAEVTGDAIVMFDVDGSADPHEIPRFIKALTDGADLAKGSRFCTGGGSEDITRVRWLGNIGLTLLGSALTINRFTDLCYGYNAFWADQLYMLDLPEVNTQESLRMMQGDGFEIEALIVGRLALSGATIAEVPSFEHHRYHGSGNLKAFKDGSRVLWTMVKDRAHARNFRKLAERRCASEVPSPRRPSWMKDVPDDDIRRLEHLDPGHEVAVMRPCQTNVTSPQPSGG